MEKIANFLRQARERRGITLAEAAQKTRIPLSYLTMLEGKTPEGKGQTHLLPDPLYLIPHLRNYAAFLDIDPNSAVGQFAIELQDAQERSAKVMAPELPSQLLGSSPQRSRAMSVSIVLASVLVTLALIGQYSDMNARAPGFGDNRALYPLDSSLQKNIPSPPTPLPSTSAPLPSGSRSRDSSAPLGPSSSQTHSPSSGATSVRPSPSVALSTSPAADSPQAGSSQATPPQPGTETPPVTALAQQPASGSSHLLRVQAREATWIRILVAGQPPEELILRPGESETWTSDSTFQLTLGNAGGVTLNLNGQDLPPLGKSGQVLRNLRLPFSSTENQG